jgi:transposase
MRLWRAHSREFKLMVVRELLAGQVSRAHLCHGHNLAPTVVTRWKQEYQERGEEAFTSARPTPQALAQEDLTARVAELERFCGQLAWENALLKKTLEKRPSPSGTP